MSYHGSMNSHLWTIQLFGGLHASQQERRISRFRTQKTGSLLGYLAYHLGRSHPREVLIEMLWPDAAPESGRHNLSLALSSLRNQLEPPGVPAGSVLLADHLSVELNPASVLTDVAAFEAMLRQAAQATNPEQRATLLMQAADLYDGAFLPGYYDEWITTEQERLALRFQEAVHQLVALRERDGAGGDSLSAVTGYARRALEADPLREEAHQDLIRLLLALGQPSAALRQWRDMERILDEEVGEQPGRASRHLLRQIEENTASDADGVPALFPPAPNRPVAMTARTLALPTGTVTFLLTDIEGSTALWERRRRVPRHPGASPRSAARRVSPPRRA